jgi:hypothetical protein
MADPLVAPRPVVPESGQGRTEVTPPAQPGRGTILDRDSTGSPVTRSGGASRGTTAGRAGAATPPEPTPALRETSAATARELEEIVSTLDPDRVSAATARAAIGSLQGILPKLATFGDTMKADLNRAGAHFYLQEIDIACSLLRSLQARAPSQSRPAIETQIAGINCPSP